MKDLVPFFTEGMFARNALSLLLSARVSRKHLQMNRHPGDVILVDGCHAVVEARNQVLLGMAFTHTFFL
jgi:hypothetical protein